MFLTGHVFSNAFHFIISLIKLTVIASTTMEQQYEVAGLDVGPLLSPCT